MQSTQDRLRQARLSANLTQKEIAQKIGMTQQAYQKIEIGKAPDIKISTLYKICATLNISSDWLLGLEE